MADVKEFPERYFCGDVGIPIPPRALRGLSGPAELDYFLAIGEAAAQNIFPFLSPDPRILDVGCGCGKVARFLIGNPRIHYVGIDVLKDAIEWSNRAFEQYSNRFRFQHMDVYSEWYNAEGRLAADRYVFPFADNEFDFVICGSLFTHLLQHEMHRYLSEISRCLTPGGRLWASIHTQHADEATPFSGTVSRIDMTEAFWQEACEKHGLTLHHYIGGFCGQYVFVMKTAATGEKHQPRATHRVGAAEQQADEIATLRAELDSRIKEQGNEIAALAQVLANERADIAELRHTIETGLRVGWEEINALKRRVNTTLATRLRRFAHFRSRAESG